MQKGEAPAWAGAGWSGGFLNGLAPVVEGGEVQHVAAQAVVLHLDRAACGEDRAVVEVLVGEDRVRAPEGQLVPEGRLVLAVVGDAFPL